QQVVFLTGCSHGGIDSALCEEYADRGNIVCASSRRLASMEGFTYPRDQKGRIDVFISNAGLLCCEQAKVVMDTNFFGTLSLHGETAKWASCHHHFDCW
ncbi:hypothetical protein BKA62DRAFT_728603, partial [Auriculariales sp. MPI-PUGE-AT-0066]